MRRLDNIRVEGFKSIRNLDLGLNSLNVLIGANGAGKSNFIALFRLLNQIVEGRLQLAVGKAGGPDALLYFGQKNTSEIKIELDFGINGYKCILVPSAKNTLIFKEEVCFYKGKDFTEPFSHHLGSGHSESKLAENVDPRPVVRYVLNTMKDWQVYHFHDTSDSAKVKNIGDINDNEKLRPDAANLAAFLYRLREKHPAQYRTIVETIQMAAPFFDGFTLRPSPLNGTIQLEWREKNSDAYFNAGSLSDGTLRFMCLATLLLQPTPLLPSTVLIDEPELGLHPYAINLLASMLQSAATKTQVIVSTQSVPLVNQFTPEDLIVVDREEGQSIFKRLEEQEIAGWMEEYGLGDLWEKNVLGGRPRR